MGFCTDAEYREFMRQAPEFKRNLVRSGVHLIKFWFPVSRDEQRRRCEERKAHPLKLSLFSFILGQHQRLLEWLGSLTFIDGARIGFYGLSYGGKTAVRVPPLLDGYAVSICSADFNVCVLKTTSVDSPYSYVFTC